MSVVMAPPFTRVETVTDILHGVPVTDPYRWLEDENSLETRVWIAEQTRYARSYLDRIPGREHIRRRVRELLDVETYDSLLKCGRRYVFRKRLPGQEQPSIYVRDSAEGPDELLVDPALRSGAPFTAVKPVKLSTDGSLLLYEVKHGGERMGRFEIFDLRTRQVLPDDIPHGYLRGFAFSPEGKSFYYVHESTESERPFHHAVFRHTLGTSPQTDSEVFSVGDDVKTRLVLIASKHTLGFLVYRFLEKTYTDFYIQAMTGARAITVLRDAAYRFAPYLVPGRILAQIDLDAPNLRIVEVQARNNANPLYFNLVGESDSSIRHWAVTANLIVVSYVNGTRSEIQLFDHFGKHKANVPCEPGETVRLVAASSDDDELILERESFTEPVEVFRYSPTMGIATTWAQPLIPFPKDSFVARELTFQSKDGTAIPMSILGAAQQKDREPHPVILNSYGGHGVPLTPQFSVFVSFLIEHGCLFALPHIRGGGEFGALWHNAAKRRNRQVAFDDFLSAAESLLASGQTTSDKLAIFGGSNSGLLVATALTQRPELFRAVLCLVPILDMLRYHLYDSAHVWRDEFGTAEDPEDFRALCAYSPYHAVRDGVSYPAAMIVSGDADQNCNPLHARKMTARLQSANASRRPIVLDYNVHRGHSPVLPISMRVEALTDRLAFLSDQLGLPI